MWYCLATLVVGAEACMTSRHVPAERGANQSGLRARVGLTRHCVNSGVITLPFALQEALPEGEFSVMDADGGSTHQVRVTAGRPRRMHGLSAFVQAYGLQVNDRIEITIQPDGGVRLRAERKTPAGQAPAESATAAAPETGDAATKPDLPLGDATGERSSDGTVVERIGTVTVRRINARQGDFQSEATLANADDIERALAARKAELDAEADAGAEFEPLEDHFLLSDTPAEPAAAEEEPEQGGLFAATSQPQGPALGARVRDDQEAAPASDSRRNPREEALSQAGDLRSQMLRWFMRPDVPVIVPFERLMQEFGLTRDVVADVIDGIVEDPPEGLSLTLIREGTLRVAQTEVAVNTDHQRAS